MDDLERNRATDMNAPMADMDSDEVIADDATDDAGDEDIERASDISEDDMGDEDMSDSEMGTDAGLSSDDLH